MSILNLLFLMLVLAMELRDFFVQLLDGVALLFVLVLEGLDLVEVLID